MIRNILYKVRNFLCLIAMSCILACNTKTTGDSPSGEYLFKTNCSNCHKIDKEYTGPSLKAAIGQRGEDWVFIFLTNPGQLKPDSIQEMNKKKFGFNCQHFPDLTKEDIHMINEYCCMCDPPPPDKSK